MPSGSSVARWYAGGRNGLRGCQVPAGAVGEPVVEVADEVGVEEESRVAIVHTTSAAAPVGVGGAATNWQVRPVHDDVPILLHDENEAAS